MKRNKKVLALSILSLFGVVCLAAGLMLGGNTAMYGNTNDFVFYAPLVGADKTSHQIDPVVAEITEPITDISLDLTYFSHVDIVAGDIFQVEYNAVETSHAIANGTLSIQQSGPREGFHSFFSVSLFGLGSLPYQNNRVTLTIPQDTPIDTLSLHLNSGDLTISEGDFGTVTIFSDYGDISLSDLTADQMDIISNSGDVQGDALTVDDLKIDANYGDITLDNITHTTSNISTQSGDVTLSDITGDALTLYTAYGEMRLENMEQNTTKLTSGSGDLALAMPTIGTSLDIALEYGDVTLSLPKAVSQYQITATTDYGDVSFGDGTITATDPTDDKRPTITAHTRSGDISVVGQ